MDFDVIVIGAGAAGLAAARVVADAGQSVLIVEARDRIGGRIATVRDQPTGLAVELGAEFVHGRPEATWKLLRRAGLVAYDVPFENWRRRRGRLVRAESFEEQIGLAMRGLARVKHDMSFAEYLRRHDRGAVPARRWAEACAMGRAFVEGFDAADTQVISALSLAAEQTGVGDLEDETQFRLMDGYGGLMDYLRRSLGRRVDVKLGVVVHEVRWKKGAVEVECAAADSSSRKTRRGGRTRIFKAHKLIITLPLGVFLAASGGAGAVRFSPDIPEHRKAARQLGYGGVKKVVLAFEEAFWERPEFARAAGATCELRDASFFQAVDGAFPTWWTALPLRAPLLTGWAGGPRADALAGVSGTALKGAALKSLAALFGRRVSWLEERLRGFHTHDWQADPFSRGAYSYVKVGGMRARGELAKPLEGTLFFAGEATDTSGQASTVAGALASGERAGREVVEG